MRNIITVKKHLDNGGIIKTGQTIINSKGKIHGKMIRLTGGILEQKTKYITYKQPNGAEVFQNKEDVYVLVEPYKAVNPASLGSVKEYSILTVLVDDILNTQVKQNTISSKVKLHVVRFYNALKAVKTLSHYKKYFGEYLYKETVSNIMAYRYPIAVETHLLNFIAAVYRNEVLNRKPINQK